MFKVYCERPTTGQVWDMMAIGEIKVSKSTNEPSSLQATFLRDKMTVERGDIIGVQLDERGTDDVNLFYGFVYVSDKHDDEVDITAYDQLYALKQSKEYKVYGNIKASDLFRQMVDEHKLRRLDPPFIVDTEFTIPDVIADGKAPLTLMTEALNVTYNHTGKEFYMYDFFDNMCIGETTLHRIPIQDYELNGLNIKHEGYHYKEDGSETVNEVIIKSNDSNNTVLAVRRDEEDILRHGTISIEEKVKDGENPDVVADQLFNSKRLVTPKLSLEVYGCNPQLYPARGVHVDFFTCKKEFILGWFKVDSVSYTLKDGSGDMSVELTLDEMEWDAFG